MIRTPIDIRYFNHYRCSIALVIWDEAAAEQYILTIFNSAYTAAAD
jgi:hypothetical protein